MNTVKAFIFKIFIAICLLSPLSYTNSFAQTPATENEIEFNDAALNMWMQQYYIHKDSENVKAFLKYISTSKIFEEKESTIPPLSGFLSVVFAENPNKIDEWLNTTKFEGNVRYAMNLALLYGGFPDKLKTFSPKEFENFNKKQLKAPTEIKSPDEEDYFWGRFFASGDESNIIKFIDILDSDKIINDNKTMNNAIKQAAVWSLASNMTKHIRVAEIIKKQEAVQTGETKNILQTLTSYYETNRKEHSINNGDFFAKITIIDKDQLKEFDKPSDEMLKLIETNKAKVGDIVALKIIFANASLSSELNIDVDYDIKVTAPDGKIYSELDAKKLIGLKTKLINANSIFDNQEVVMLRFEDIDPIGTYKIDAVVHDNISNKSIPLHGEITLSKK